MSVPSPARFGEVVVVPTGRLPSCHLGNQVGNQTGDTVLTVAQRTRPALNIATLPFLTAGELYLALVCCCCGPAWREKEALHARVSVSGVGLTFQKETVLQIPGCWIVVASREFTLTAFYFAAEETF